MQTYLINLGRRPDRLASMTAQGAALGVVLDRVEACDAAAAPPQASCRIFGDGIRSRVFAEATLIRYGAWT